MLNELDGSFKKKKKVVREDSEFQRYTLIK